MSNGEASARAKEIVEAFDDWLLKEEQAYHRIGGYAAEQRENEIARSLQRIKSQILKTPASTIHGILIKANVIEISACPDEDITHKIRLLLGDIRSVAQAAGLPRLPNGNHVLASALSN